MNGLKSWTRNISLAGLYLAIAGLLVQTSQVASAAGAGAAQTEPKQSVYVEDGAIGTAISGFIAEELKLTDANMDQMGAIPMMEVSVGGLPSGYTREFVAFIYTDEEGIELLLLGADAKMSQMTLLARESDDQDEEPLFINTSKLDVSYTGNRLIVWSQAPFRAFESNAVLEWNGKSLSVVSHEYDDPSQRFYDKKRELIAKKDIKGLIAQFEEEWAQYPAFYPEFFELAEPALLLSYEKALDVYKKDVKTAIRYLEYGLRQYEDTYLTAFSSGSLTKVDIVGEPDDFDPPKISFNKYVAILNDYAYFLSLAGRNKEAKPILANIIKLVPGRVVAYLNLADVEWALEQKAAAKAHYKQYLRLLGSKAAKVAPKRVQERINAK